MELKIMIAIDDPRFERLEGANDRERLAIWLQGVREGFFDPIFDSGVRLAVSMVAMDDDDFVLNEMC